MTRAGTAVERELASQLAEALANQRQLGEQAAGLRKQRDQALALVDRMRAEGCGHCGRPLCGECYHDRMAVESAGLDSARAPNEAPCNATPQWHPAPAADDPMDEGLAAGREMAARARRPR